MIVHTNDLHAHIESFAAVLGIAKEELARRPTASIFLDAGDTITGTPVSTIWQGTPVFELMNGLPLTAGALGNHEFDHGWAKVHGFVELARQPLLCANVKDPKGKQFGDGDGTLVVESGGVKIGILGLMAGDLRRLTTKTATEGCEIEPPLDTAARVVPELRKRADMVIVLSHIGVENDAAIAGAVKGIDLIVGGHSHTKLDEALSVNGTWIVQAGNYGRHVGVIDLEWDADARRIAEFRYRLRPTTAAGTPKDAAMAKAVAAWEAKVDAQLGAVIGRADRPLGKKALRPLIEQMYASALGCDLGFQNMGGIRDDIEAGDIRIRDVWNVLPFDNTMVKVHIPGAKLTEFQRQKIGASLDETKLYTVATNSYVGDQMKEHFGSDGFRVEDTGLVMRDVAVKWVREHGGFDPAGKPLPTSEK